MKKKWTYVFRCDSFCSQLKLANAMTLEETREKFETDPVCNEFKKNGHEYLGILDVDVTKSGLSKMGYQFV